MVSSSLISLSIIHSHSVHRLPKARAASMLVLFLIQCLPDLLALIQSLHRLLTDNKSGGRIRMTVSLEGKESTVASDCYRLWSTVLFTWWKICPFFPRLFDLFHLKITFICITRYLQSFAIVSNCNRLQLIFFESCRSSGLLLLYLYVFPTLDSFRALFALTAVQFLPMFQVSSLRPFFFPSSHSRVWYQWWLVPSMIPSHWLVVFPFFYLPFLISLSQWSLHHLRIYGR